MTDRNAIEWNYERARQMREEGKGWTEIGRRFGIAPDTARKKLDREYWARRRARQRENAKSPSVTRSYVKADVIENVPPVPADTRGLTARICGDPLPGRSALDIRRAEATP